MRSSFSKNDSWQKGYAYDGYDRMLGELSQRAYNLVLGGTLAWGFIINAIICLFFGELIFSIPPQILLIGYLISAFVGVLMTMRSQSPLVSFIGYNLVVLPLGAVLTLLVSVYDPDIVLLTMLITAIVVVGLTICAALFPRIFLALGPTLGVTLLLTLLASLICSLVGIVPAWLDLVVALLFCGYIGYDFSRAQKKVKTLDSAIDSACELYVDIVNLFIRILAIVDRSSKRR